jgi:hypothetical protein
MMSRSVVETSRRPMMISKRMMKVSRIPLNPEP